MKTILLVICIFNTFTAYSQDIPQITETPRKWNIGLNAGIGVSYTDMTYLVNFPTSVNVEYKISEKYSVQFAPKYTWLTKWNEHYLTLPVHFGIEFGNKLRLFAGPALSFDLGYFKDLGISAGAYYHLSQRLSIILSMFTFTLYDYYIDYLFVPIALSFNYIIY